MEICNHSFGVDGTWKRNKLRTIYFIVFLYLNKINFQIQGIQVKSCGHIFKCFHCCLLQEEESQSLLQNFGFVQESETQFFDHEETVVCDQAEEVIENEQNSNFHASSICSTPSPLLSSSSNSFGSNKKRKIECNEAGLLDKAEGILNCVSSRLGGRSAENSSSKNEAFGRFLVGELDKFTDEMVLLVTKHKLQQVLMDAQIEDIRKKLNNQ